MTKLFWYTSLKGFSKICEETGIASDKYYGNPGKVFGAGGKDEMVTYLVVGENTADIAPCYPAPTQCRHST